MKRLQMVECRPEDGEAYSEMLEREDGPYCLYSDASAVIGDLRKRLEDTNHRLEVVKGISFGHRYGTYSRPGSSR